MNTVTESCWERQAWTSLVKTVGRVGGPPLGKGWPGAREDKREVVFGWCTVSHLYTENPVNTGPRFGSLCPR